MKHFAFFAASLLIAGCLATLIDDEAASVEPEAGRAPAASRLASPLPAPEDGLALGGFVEAWSLRHGGRPDTAQAQAPSEEEQRQRRVAAFMARMVPSANASANLRPGDRAGLRDGDRALGLQKTPPREQAAEQEAAERVRKEQVLARVQAFQAAMERRLAQADAKNTSRAVPVPVPGLRPGDKVGARAGDLASLQRKHP